MVWFLSNLFNDLGPFFLVFLFLVNGAVKNRQEVGEEEKESY